MEQSTGGISIISCSNIVTDNWLDDEKVKNNKQLSTMRTENAEKNVHRVSCKRKCRNVVTELLITGLAELIGTTILVFLGCLGCVGGMGNVPSMVQICMSFGFAVTIALTGVGHISGAHINPAVTIGALVCGYLSFLSASVYIVSQLIGAIFGYGLLKMITPQNLLHSGNPGNVSNFCMTQLHDRVSVVQGFFCEFIATGLLVFMFCASGDRRNSKNTDSTSIKFGLAVAALCFGFVPYTGCGINPARSFAPAIFNNLWTDHWIYWVGPIFGSIVTSFLYKFIFLQTDDN